MALELIQFMFLTLLHAILQYFRVLDIPSYSDFGSELRLYSRLIDPMLVDHLNL